MTKRYPKVAIVGCGPSGLSCAIQLKRYGLDTVVFERERVGGLICNAGKIVNLPGLKGAISGRHFSQNMIEQAVENSLSVILKEITRVDYSKETKQFRLDSETNIHFSDYLVLATGSKPVLPEFSYPRSSSGILTEVFSVMNEKNKKVIIVGGGDISLDYALSMSRHNYVIILSRSSRLKALPVLIDDCHKAKNIDIRYNLRVKMVEEVEGTLRVHLKDSNEILKCDLLLFAIGRTPRKDLAEELKKNEPELKLNRKLFIIGDCCNGSLRQISIAAGDGMKAAMLIRDDMMRRKN
jgi:thioredoxin reductase